MKKIFIFIFILIIGFFAVWAVKTHYAKKNTEKEYPTRTGDTVKNWWDSDLDVSDEWKIDDEIPENYIPVPGKKETYMVIDIETGEIKAYRKREKETDENGKVIWKWSDIEETVQKEYEPVEGKKDLYKKTGADGKITYYRYVRNSDGTYAFVEVNPDGSDLTVPSGKSIPQNYRKIIDNYYSVYNDAGVIIGYKKRSTDENGNNVWESVTREEVQKYIDLNTHLNSSNTTTDNIKDNIPTQVAPPQQKPSENSQVPSLPKTDETVSNDSTYTEVKSSTTTEIKGNYKITYTTTVTKIYDSNGKLLQTITDGPNEVSRELIISNTLIPDQSKIAGSLEAEYKRVSSQVSYNDNLVNEIFISLNADRKSNGLPLLTLDQSGDLYKMARLKAADMALYNHADFDSPMYGTLTDLSSRYGIHLNYCSESIWKTTEKTANEIHTRFQASSVNRALRMSSDIRKIAISIAVKDGYYYIYECYSD